MLLFSESNTRFLVEVTPENAAAVTAKFADGLSTVLGEVSDSRSLSVKSATGSILQSDIGVLRSSWKAPLNW